MTNIASQFRARPLILPKAFLQAVDGGMGLTEALHTYRPEMDDYRAMKDWQKMLERDFNWGGTGMLIRMDRIKASYDEEQRNPPKSEQRIITDAQGRRVGYFRLNHMKKGSALTPLDCTRMEESLVGQAEHVKDPALFRFMYDESARMAARAGKARLLTELGVGLPPGKFKTLARRMRTISRKDEISPDDFTRLKTAKRMFERDWGRVTERFIANMGCTISDVIYPADLQGNLAQFRLHRLTGIGEAIPLPDYQSASPKGSSRIGKPYLGEESLAELDEFFEKAREEAREIYDPQDLDIEEIAQRLNPSLA